MSLLWISLLLISALPLLATAAAPQDCSDGQCSDDDRAGVMATITRFSWIMDHGKPEEMAQVFTSDVKVNGKAIGLATMIKMVGGIQAKYVATQHLMGNHQINVDSSGDTATAKSYVRAMHRKKPEHGGDTYNMVGWYEDKLVHKAGGWRIKERLLGIQWEEGEKAPAPATKK